MCRNIRTVCRNCKCIGSVSIEEDAFAGLVQTPLPGLCENCAALIAAEDRKKFAAGNEKILIEKSKIPPEFLDFDKTRGNLELAKYVWNSREKNMLIFGMVGSGKTRSVCCAAKNMVMSGSKVEYYGFQELAGKYSSLNQEGSDKGRNFIKHTLNRNDLTVIDDIDKKRYSDSVSELLYLIFDGVYSGSFRGKIWITANFANGSEMHRKFYNGDIADAVCSRIDRMAEDGRMAIWR